MTTLNSYRLSVDELQALQQNAANQPQDPYISPVYQLRSLLGV